MRIQAMQKPFKPIFILYGLLICVGCSLFLYLDYVDLELYYDDAYALQMIGWDVNEIFALTTRSDLNPPLYYLMLKGYTTILGDTVFVARTFSCLAVFATMLLAVFPIRKRFGDRVSISFLILLILFPISQFLATEIRVYSWAMFFTLATAICTYDIYEKGRNIDWIKFTILAICSAYLHYYALITIGWLFLILGASLLLQKKMKWAKFALAAIACIIAYAPWLVYLFFQLERASALLQANAVGWYERIYYFYYFYSIKKEWLPFSDSAKSFLMYGAAIIIVLQIVLIVNGLMRAYRKRDKLSKIGLVALMLFILPVVSGGIVSYMFYPIIAARYMTVMFGLWLFAFAVFLAQILESKQFRAVGLLFLLFLVVYGGMRYYASQRHYKEWQSDYMRVKEFIGPTENNQHIFLSEYYAADALSVLSVYYPDNSFYVLIQKGWYDDFAPFPYKQINHEEPFASEFILAQKDSYHYKRLAVAFKEALDQNFQATDSLTAMGVKLYKMKVRSASDHSSD